MDGLTPSTAASNTEAAVASLSVHVLATTAEGTKCALTHARRLTDGLEARIVLLVPRLTSFDEPADPSSNNGVLNVREYRALAASVGAHVTVLTCLVQRLADVVHAMVGRSSLLIVGGRRRIWWPSREQRLVERLTAQGYAVIFAQIGADALS